MKRVLIIILFALTGFGAKAQFDHNKWDSLKTVTTENYELKIPYQWRQVETGGNGPEQYFEASGISLPTSFKGSPVIVSIFLTKQDCSNLNDCRDKCLKGYRDNPDRIFPGDFKEVQQKIKLSSGQDGWLLNTHFYRKSKGLNQSRYDLVVFSDKVKSGFIYTLSVQYADNEYKFEADNNLLMLAQKLFSYFKLN